MKHILVSLLMTSALSGMALAQPRAQRVLDVPERPQLDVEKYVVNVEMLPEEHRLNGTAEVHFRQLDRQSYATLDLDRRLRITRASINDVDVRYRQFDLDSTVEFDLSDLEQFADLTVLTIEYSGILNPEVELRDPVLGRVGESSAFLLYDARWYPTNGLYQDKAHMVLSVTAPPEWTLVTDLPAGIEPNTFASTEPSYWGMVAAGSYAPVSINPSGVEIVVSKIDASDESATALAETAGGIIDFYSSTFGPLDTMPFRIVEIEDVNWDSRYSPGTLLLASSQFREDFDKQEFAETIAHQWFPLQIAVKDPGADAWLVDGMAVFAGLMYFERTLSPAEAQVYIDKALVKALAYEGTSTVRRAGSLEKDHPDYISLVRYKGAYIFRMLQWVMGEDKFSQLLEQYVRKFKDTPASSEELQQMASEIAGDDLLYFFDQWLNSSGVPEFTEEYTIFRTTSYKVSGQLKQDLDLFRMPIELQVITDAEPEYHVVDVVGPASDFDIVVERRPKEVIIDPRKRVLRLSDDIKVAVHINRGEEYANAGELNRAIDEYQYAVDIDRHNSLALFRMGEALFELGNLQLAADTFRESLNGKLDPRWVEVWALVNLGKIFDARGQRERAVGYYTQAVNTGDDAYGAQGEAQKFLQDPFRRTGRPTIGD